ncbi:uncharacterized protein LOC132282278 [Cornus florida]|uniref:uncharacterized protein LOC132282278 n=1 Tax=Cornus florida TaxID=4283 RepID=UPI00289ABB37|nr:uncharacterized protein LOC132282278 [Cornus florida]XP_059639872.1 uncharacterized protein LOC132282278 [Cornus florida]XP_059639873.1 uncharacterized protein LOC132282278 [Cornus florida]
MVQKRPFVDEELYEVSSKQPRKLECSNQLVSSLEFLPSEDAVQKPYTSDGNELRCDGLGNFTKCKTRGDEKLTSGIITELPLCTEKEIESSAPGCISHSSWATSGTSEEDARSEAPSQLLFFPEYCDPDRPIRKFVHAEEIYSSLLDYPPRKLVPIGPDFQAGVPEWRPQGIKNASNCSGTSEPSTIFPQVSESDLIDSNEDENKFTGICVIPIPKLDPYAYDGDKVEDSSRAECCCQDMGSVRCVRQHIMEAREKLRRTLGQQRFEELGFADMGEVVAGRWSVEEEHLFHDVVFSNPTSLGKNFWSHLSMAFPFRTKKDIVSYYFNVFMLRKRAEQNRCDPMNIDSDNDEWQGSDDSGDDEDGTFEEDDDSGIESPVYHDDPGHNEIEEGDSHEGFVHATCGNYEHVDIGTDKGISEMSETCHKKFCASDFTHQLHGKILWDEMGNRDVRDDLCNSDVGVAPQVTKVKVNNNKPWPGIFSGMSGGGVHECVLEHYDSRVWDVGYLTHRRNEVDFLSTGSMIEEVFGVGAWNCKARDGKSLS